MVKERQRKDIFEEIMSINIPEFFFKKTDLLFEIAHTVNFLYLGLPTNKIDIIKCLSYYLKKLI